MNFGLKRNRKTTQNILRQLDRCAPKINFPMLDNGYTYLADVRLSAFADDTKWSLIIETLGFFNRAGGTDGFILALYCFGNHLHEPPGMSNNRFLCPINDGSPGPLFDPDDIERIRPTAKTIKIRGHEIPIPTDPAYYATKGILLVEPPRIQAFELLRGLLPEYRHLLFATENEFWQQMKSELPLILRLDEWRHPDLVNNELPSHLGSFQMIAEVISTEDPTLYRPTETANTHWSHWPEGGTF